jgi:dimethylhistidine N-methyltransferase
MQDSSTLNSSHQNTQYSDAHSPYATHAPTEQSPDSPVPANQRLHIQTLDASTASPSEHHSDADLVIQGLSQPSKTLPPRFFYDDRGSQLFEHICQLPEYYLTRTETQIFQAYADEIAKTTGECEVVELGSGSSTKTRIILDAYQAAQLPLRYVPIDVSAGILQESSYQLLNDYPSLKIYGIVGTYQQALQTLMPSTLSRRLIAFIGSTLGNLPPEPCDRFLAQIANALTPGDYFLLGIDLQKDPAVLEAAYDDSQGVTAAFNLNMLTHLNRKFSANFDVSQFEHVAFYNAELNQIEMHLRSKIKQAVVFAALNFTAHFEAGETIHSEVSRKFNLQQMSEQLRSHNLKTVKTWTDPKEWFGVVLAQRIDTPDAA